MKPLIAILIFTLSFSACNQKAASSAEQIELWKSEITQSEKQFSEMAQKDGMKVAFLHFVADDGVLLRSNNLIKGKDEIREYMKNSNSKGLKWKPDFVDVASSGDMGYTYGTYTFTYKNSFGNDTITKGIFHTVWKRQKDGNWKFVWD
ncbi:YybH family protein [Aestuariibaculum sediminum]|uniref:Nuclear transport factor 2 family protein n=1 Tax=Aestuariibaculum sediminum TaxID=2770637 RepID=A0A8J6QB74_9FLAO|nr:DUF4440 domain-containing protein [Aestuariibaculum sediminum]MBD0832701.1 nuclear transport factor 2 family protein [Aestuariibaculum sediminum]